MYHECLLIKCRPVPRSHVQALEGRIASLEQYIQGLADASPEDRDNMLSMLNLNSTGPENSSRRDQNVKTRLGEAEVIFARPQEGKLRRSSASNFSQFYGPTSLFQLQINSNAEGTVEDLHFIPPDIQSNLNINLDQPNRGYEKFHTEFFPYAPHDEIPQHLMSTFFKVQYPYNMCVYREFFLRDYDIGFGPYYSELLFNAICATGALACDDPIHRSLSPMFADQAQKLLYSALDAPNLTTLQALLILGYLEIGQGRPSKGWLFCGMSCRLAHEMGLHLDPNNWLNSGDFQIEMEVRRRVYWAVFAADKQLSLYFGRPPALYPHESDVRNTMRFPYPSDWQGLLDTYISKGTSITAYEDGIALAGTFIYRVELTKIMHTMITQLFENRRVHVDAAVVAARAHEIHVALTKWLSDLPGKLHWNLWTVGQVPAYLLHLHMLFHTTMIILHRPSYRLPESSYGLDRKRIEACNESVRGFLKLVKTYSRYCDLRSLPLHFIHMISIAAGVLLMHDGLEDSMNETKSTSLETLLSALDEIKHTWHCAADLHRSILRGLQRDSISESRLETPGNDTTTRHTFAPLGELTTLWDNGPESGNGEFAADLGSLITDDFLRDQFSWEDDLV